jgi:rod shape determining protein RodA
LSQFKNLLKNIDKVLLLFPFIFLAISILMIGSTEYADGFEITGNIIRQSAAFVLGGVAVAVSLLLDYKRLAAFPKLLYPLTLLLLLSVYTPLGSTQYGTRGWLDLGLAYLQPAELCKIFFVLLMAAYLSQNAPTLQSFRGLLRCGLYAAPIIGLVVLQNDLGNALVYCFIVVVMMIVAGAGYRQLGTVALFGIALSPLFYLLLKDHQQQRILAFFHPNDLSLPGNYQVWQSKIAIGSGGFSGKGLFMGTQKQLDWLPVQESDFIFAVIVEELGLIGGAALIGLFTLFLLRMLRVGEAAEDFQGELIVYGVFAMMFFQIFENMAMTMGLMPVTGITLPFISYGGSSMLTNMLALALVLNVNMRSKLITF